MNIPEDLEEKALLLMDLDMIDAYLKAAAKVYGKVLAEDEVEPDEGLIEEVGR